MKKSLSFFFSLFLIIFLAACGQTSNTDEGGRGPSENNFTERPDLNTSDQFVLISGGSFQMGSPESEAWRSADETQHHVTVSDFYMSRYELTQKEYEEIMGNNPSSFTGSNLPVESVSWLDAVTYCNARSEKEGLTPAYKINGQEVTWDRSANGYRLPTEAEWEYACARELPRRSIWKTRRALRKRIIMVIIPIRSKTTIFHRGIWRCSPVSTGKRQLQWAASPQIHMDFTICMGM